MKKVAAAIIIHNKKVLITRRKAGLDGEGLWEFPGGKIEAGETPHDCLKRELREELHITIQVHNLFGCILYDNKQFVMKLYAYIASWISGEITLSVHDSYAWIEPINLDAYTFLPADQLFIKQLKQKKLFNNIRS